MHAELRLDAGCRRIKHAPNRLHSRHANEFLRIAVLPVSDITTAHARLIRRTSSGQDQVTVALGPQVPVEMPAVATASARRPSSMIQTAKTNPKELSMNGQVTRVNLRRAKFTTTNESASAIRLQAAIVDPRSVG